MTRAILAALLCASPAFAADDPILDELEKAKAAHAKELRILRQNLLDDIDKVIRQTNDMGGGIDYMLRERKGFAESGVTPILPKLKGASDNYLEAKIAADGTLEAAYATAADKSIKAGKLLQGSTLKAEVKAMRDARQGVRNPPALPPVAGPKDTPDERPTQRLGGAAKPGEERVFEIAKGVKMAFCWIPAGKATLGSPESEKDRGPRETEHPFETAGFWLGKYEVTQGEYEAVTGTNPSKFKGGRLPVEGLNWADCQAFVNKCRVSGLTPKLPHEDEWEYACRGGGGNKQPFPWGHALHGDKANCDGTKPYGTSAVGPFHAKTAEVGRYERVAGHPWGLCDVCGNVWEWCDNAGPLRVIRGGCWIDAAAFCRAANRAEHDPAARLAGVGFRLALGSGPAPRPVTDAPAGGQPPAPRPSVPPTGGPTDTPAVPPVKDEKVEKDIARAKFNFTAAAKAAAAALLETYEEAKGNVVAAKKMTDAAKLAYLDALAKDRAAFEREGVRPRHPALLPAAKRYDEAASKARVEFAKAVDEAAKVYADRKDTANHEALIREKQRFLDRPTAINLLDLLAGKKEKIPGEFDFRNGVLTGRLFVEIPYEPGPEYDLHLTLERLTSDDYIAVGLVAGDNQFYAVFDGWPAAGYRSGLQYINGKLLIHNGTEKAGRSIPPKTAVDIDVSVRKDSVRAWVRKKDERERRLIVNYTGSTAVLHTGAEHGIKNKKALFLITLDSKIAVSTYDLVPVGPDAGRPAR